MVRTVAVIGAGISGLSAAWELISHDADVSVTVLEGSDRLGGKLRLEDDPAPAALPEEVESLLPGPVRF